MLDDYRHCRYQDGGRGEVVSGVRVFDCYGLARAVRHEQYDLSLLPAFAGIDPNDKPTASASFAQVIADLAPGEPQDGALALCWGGRLAIHCGVVVTVDGRPGVLEADEGVDVRWVPLRTFTRRFTRVEFYL